VACPVPGDVCKTDQLAVLPSTGPPEAVALELCLPVGPRSMAVVKAFGMQCFDLGAGKRSPPLVGVGHAATLPDPCTPRADARNRGRTRPPAGLNGAPTRGPTLARPKLSPN
jgi:hypothetical protein